MKATTTDRLSKTFGNSCRERRCAPSHQNIKAKDVLDTTRTAIN